MYFINSPYAYIPNIKYYNMVIYCLLQLTILIVFWKQQIPGLYYMQEQFSGTGIRIMGNVSHEILTYLAETVEHRGK